MYRFPREPDQNTDNHATAIASARRSWGASSFGGFVELPGVDLVGKQDAGVTRRLVNHRQNSSLAQLHGRNVHVSTFVCWPLRTDGMRQLNDDELLQVLNALDYLNI